MRNSRIINNDSGRFCAFCGVPLPVPMKDLCTCAYARAYADSVAKITLLDKLADARSRIEEAIYQKQRQARNEQAALLDLEQHKRTIDETILCPG